MVPATGRTVPDSDLASRDFKKLLLIKLSAMGDVVQTIPVLNKLRQRYPKAQIDWLVTPPNDELLRDNPAISNVVEFSRAEWTNPWRMAPFAGAARLIAVLRAAHAFGPVHLLVDSKGLKLCGAGEWLLEKHGTKTRRSWRKLHIGLDADSGQIVATVLTTNDVDDASQVSPLLDQVEGPLASVLATAPTIRTPSMASSRSAILTPWSSCHHVLRRCRAKQLRPNLHSATAISDVLPSEVGSAGRRRRAITSAAALRPPSDVTRR